MIQRKQQQGFGLLEVVISAGILALVVGAATGLIRSSLRRTVLAADRSVAMNLAQEGIEQVRSARDSTFIDGDPSSGWDAHLLLNCQDVILPATFADCSLKITRPDGSHGWQVEQSNEPEKISMNGLDFKREIYITVPNGFVGNTDIQTNPQILDSDVVRRVHVIVRWDNDKQAVESETYLTNWRSGI